MPIGILFLRKNASVIYSLFACLSACRIILGATRRSRPKIPDRRAVIKNIILFNGSPAYVYPRKADTPSSPMPMGILFLRKTVSVINKRLACRSAFKITSGTKINNAPKTAEIIPIIRIINMGFTIFEPLISFRCKLV